MPFAPSLLSSSSSVSQFLPRFPDSSRLNVSSRTRSSFVVVSDLASVDSTTLAVFGGGDKEVVREYFNSTGFKRWRKIYGETDEVNRVQKDIRLGHAKTVENAMLMLKDEGSLAGVTVCDAGCGTGSLSIPLAKEGAIVSAAMVSEAEMKAKEQLPSENLPRFEVNDLESLSGKYDTVVCLDVLIQNKADGMIAHLASLAEKRVILSFAPKTFYYDILKRIGELFPGPSKATRRGGCRRSFA